MGFEGVNCPIQGFVWRLLSTVPNYRVHSFGLQEVPVVRRVLVRDTGDLSPSSSTRMSKVDGIGLSQEVLIWSREVLIESRGLLSGVSVVWSDELSSNSSLGIFASPKGKGSR